MTATRVMVDARSPANPAAPKEATARPSFGSVYRDYFDFVWSCSRRLGVPMDAIDDVVQEVFIVVHNRLHTLERTTSLRSWVYGVVRRTVSMHHRGRARSDRDSSGPYSDDTANLSQPSPLDLALFSDEVKLLWRLLGEIDPMKREVLVLAELEEMTAPEIAEALEVPLNTAYSRLRAARQEFNEAFSRFASREKTRR